MPKRTLFLLYTFLFFTMQSLAQQPGSDNDTMVYRIYGNQIAELLEIRGMAREEIDELMKIYKDNNISSDDNVAKLLDKLYPSDRGIAIMFYYFKNDTLRKVLFEPGKVIGKEYLAIKREELLQLSTDFNHTLGLYSSTDNRMPLKRGAIVKPPPASKGLTYEGLVKKTSQLLLPASFNKSYKHLIIIPALNIGTIPFHLLTPFGDNSLLIDNCSFSIAPTIIDLLGLRIRALRYATRWNGTLSKAYNQNPDFVRLDSVAFTLENPLFISNPAYPTTSEFSFPDLPGAKKEIKEAIPYAKTYILLEGKNAIKDTVLKYIGNSDVVYFATHGIADSFDIKDKSFLVLSGP